MSGASGIVIFDYSVWVTIYPEFAGVVTQPQAQSYFNRACLFVANTPASIVPACDPYGTPVRAEILGMLTSHLATLLGPGSSEVVGRVASANQGSVSVTLDMGTVSNNAAWWLQTKYGALAWQALAPYRTFRYRPSPRPNLGVNVLGRGGYRG